MSIGRASGLRFPVGVILLAAVLCGCARRDEPDADKLSVASPPRTAPPAAGQAAPPRPAPPAASPPTRGADDSPPPKPAAPLDGAKYALLVGVKTYIPTELKSLRYTENDVTDLADALKGGGYRADNVRLLTKAAADADPSAMPTAQNVRDELARLVRDCKAGDSVLVALAGHGVQYKNSDDSYFCPADARLADKNTLLSLSEICGQLDKCKAGFKLLLVDACRNDPFVDAARDVAKLDLESVSRPAEKLQAGGTVVLLSCSAGEKAFEDEDLKHGVFFNFVIEGLRGDADLDQDGVVVLPELELFAKKQVKRFVANKFQSSQMPDLVSRSSRDLVPLVQVKDARISLSSFVEDANSFVAGTPVTCSLQAVSPDGRTVVLLPVGITGEDPLSIWDVPSKKEIAKLSAFGRGLDNGLIPPMSTDGNLVASQYCGPNGPDGLGCYHALIYDRAAGKVTTDWKSGGGKQWWDQVAFAANGSLVCWEKNNWDEKNGVLRYGDLRRLDAATGATLPVFPKGEKLVSGVVAISANAEVLARLVGNKDLEIWDAAKGQMLSRSSWVEANNIKSADNSPIYSSRGQFLLTPDGKSLLEMEPYLKHQVTVWDTASGKERCTIPFVSVTGECPARMATCSDGKTVVVRYDSEAQKSYDEDTSHLKFFDLATGKERPNATRLDRVMDFVLSPDGAKMATLHKLLPRGKEWVVKVGDLPASVRKK